MEFIGFQSAQLHLIDLMSRLPSRRSWKFPQIVQSGASKNNGSSARVHHSLIQNIV
jgi:hypothetical protein